MSALFLTPTDPTRADSPAPEFAMKSVPACIGGFPIVVSDDAYMTCPACEAAQTNPYTGEMRAGCVQCTVRAVSNSPKSIREQYYRLIKDDEERTGFKAAVLAEFGRRNLLVAQRIRDSRADSSRALFRDSQQTPSAAE